jgi:hypothetical protein
VNLQQEYYLRNGVYAPYVFHGSSQVLLALPGVRKPHDRYRWIQVKFTNEGGNDGANIGRFNFQLMTPYRSSSSLFLISQEDSVYWETYPEFILNNVTLWQEEGWSAITEPDQMKMSAWEIIAYSQDDRFSSLPISYLDMCYSILEESNPFDERLKTIDDFLTKVTVASESGSSQSAYRGIVEAWTAITDLINSKKYAYWLAQLMNRGKCD